MNLIKKIFSPICLVFSIIILFFIIYKSEVYWNGTKREFYFVYYLISGILILFSTITFYVNEKIKTYLIIILGSIILSLYAFEFHLITYNWKLGEISKRAKIFKQKTGKDFDIRSKQIAYNDFIKKYINATIIVPPAIYRDSENKIYPLSGVSNSKTLFCNESGNYAFYQSDRYGFNNPDKEWEKKEIEYLIVGDSFAHGACVNRPNDIASVLRVLSNKAVLNLGYSGNGPLLEYATLREYLKPNVKKVLWLYYERNDIGNLNTELNSEILNSYLKNLSFSQNLQSKQSQIDKKSIETIKIENKWFLKFIKLENTRTNLIKRFKFQPLYAYEKADVSTEFIKILEQTKKLISKNNSTFYFVYLPEYERYSVSNYNSSYYEVKKIIEDLNIVFIDIHKEVFAKESNPLKLFPFGINGHYNKEGYSKVAKAIHKFVSK